MPINTLIVSFDYHRECDYDISFAVASLLGYVRNAIHYQDFFINSFSFDMNQSETIFKEQYEQLMRTYNLSYYGIIAISLYCWCTTYVNELIRLLKLDNKNAKIVLGGYEVQRNQQDDLQKEYEHCDYFIIGYAEESLLRLINGEEQKSRFVRYNIKGDDLPLLYSGNLIPLKSYQKVRMESKRGCIYNCSFCAHRDVSNSQVIVRPVDSVIKELKYINDKNILKVNFVDPTFNQGDTYLQVLEAMVEMKFTPQVSFQTRFESIRGDEGERFLNLVERLDTILEFGLQTSNDEEARLVNRRNDLNHIEEVLMELNKRKINYVVSLIYGLPMQTLNSFKESVKFLMELGCKQIECFPLMLLKGTILYNEKDKFGFVEERVNGITYVIESFS